MSTSSLLALTCCACSLFVSSIASAQDKAQVKLTEEQIALNNRAVKSMAQEPPLTDEAIRLTQAALVVGEKGDLLYLTLGRAYQLQKKCARAQAEFKRALTAPGVEGIPKDYVSKQIAVYQKELEASCKGTLVVNCEPKDLTLSLPGHELMCQEPLAIEPGTYSVSAVDPKTGAGTSIQVTVTSMQTTTTSFRFDQTSKEPVTPEPAVVPPPPEPKRWTIGGVVGVPVGMCLTRVGNESLSAASTNTSLCYGGRADVRSRFALSDMLSVGGVAGGRGLWANSVPVYSEREEVVATGFDASAGAQLWLWRERLGAEVVGVLRRRWVEIDNEDAGAGFLMSVGPGVMFDGADFISGLDALVLSARWTPWKDSGASFEVRAERGPLALWVSYEQWSGALDYPEDSSIDLTHEAEELMVGVGFHWGD